MFAGVCSMTAKVASRTDETATHSHPLQNEGNSSGTVTRLKTCHGDAPLMSAASSSSLLI